MAAVFLPNSSPKELAGKQSPNWYELLCHGAILSILMHIQHTVSLSGYLSEWLLVGHSRLRPKCRKLLNTLKEGEELYLWWKAGFSFRTDKMAWPTSRLWAITSKAIMRSFIIWLCYHLSPNLVFIDKHWSRSAYATLSLLQVCQVKLWKTRQVRHKLCSVCQQIWFLAWVITKIPFESPW